eukprot:9289048-Pyramimonas_sp.AAC.1
MQLPTSGTTERACLQQAQDEVALGRRQSPAAPSARPRARGSKTPNCTMQPEEPPGGPLCCSRQSPPGGPSRSQPILSPLVAADVVH